MEDKINITTGFEFDLNLFDSNIRNCGGLNKPIGGLWGSPENSEYGWKDWCESEDFNKNEGIDVCFRWKFKDTAKVLKINSEKDYVQLLDKYLNKIDNPYLPDRYKYLDWSKIAEDYDGFHLTYDGFCQLRENYAWGFYSWDCESVIVFNLENFELL